MVEKSPNHVYIEELGELIGRSHKTIRTWLRESERVHDIALAFLNGRSIDEATDDERERLGLDYILPQNLWPEQEGGRQVLRWHRSQIDEIREFSEKKNSRRGWQNA